LLKEFICRAEGCCESLDALFFRVLGLAKIVGSFSMLKPKVSYLIMQLRGRLFPKATGFEATASDEFGRFCLAYDFCALKSELHMVKGSSSSTAGRSTSGSFRFVGCGDV
jgi:hypothetical protein